MMTRFLSFAVASIVAVSSLAGCQSSQGSGASQASVSPKKWSIVTTIFPPYDFARQIVGDRAEVTMLLPPGTESHSYEPAPKDMKTIQNCDLFIYTGGENDVWVEDLLRSMGDQKPDTLRLLDCVPTVMEVVVEGMEPEGLHDHDRDEKDPSATAEHGKDAHDASPSATAEHGKDAHDEAEHGGELDEHVWTSPVHAMEIVQRISSLLCEKDAAHADFYKKNTAAYLGQLEKLDAAFQEVVAHAKRRTILFGDRFPFRYFADRYGLTYYAAFTGCSTETEASAATVAFLIDKVRQEQLPVVFTIELSNGKIADAICEATGAQKRILFSCHNVTKKQLQEGATYLSMMTENVDALRAALN